MRKRSTKEISQLVEIMDPVALSGSGDVPPDREKEVSDQRKKDQSKKPSTDEIIKKQRIRKAGEQIKSIRVNRQLKIDAAERKKEREKVDARRKSDETAEKRINAATTRAQKIAGDKPKLERISSKDKSVTATGKAAMNTAKSAISLGRKVASIPDRLKARDERSKLGKAQMDRGKAPTGGTKIQRIKYATANARKKVGRGVEGIGKKIIPEDFIHEAEKGKKEIKKEKIDVMKGTNKIEVNPKSLPEAKKMTKSQIEKRDEIADAISTREMNKRYGDKNVKYAIATKLAMKKKKKKKIKEDVSGLEVQNVSDGIKFREYEFIDVVKPEPMRSPKNNITWTEARDEYGDPVDGPKISKKEKKKNLSSDDKDEKITRSEETVNEISGELANKAFKAANRKYQYADNNLTREKAYKQQKKFSGYASKKYQKLNKDRGDLNKIYNKPDAVKEAKAPEGLMKLAATVAANNKKRKNALQIQKYIGEETPDAISGKDLKRISALSGKKTRFGDGPEGTAKRKAALEKKRGMKLDDHPQFKTEGKGSNPNKRYIGDPIVTSKKSFTQTGKIGIEYETPQEKYDAEQRRKKTADPMKTYKKNKSMEKAAQNMQMLKRMTPEQKYARKMRIKQQQKDKK